MEKNSVPDPGWSGMIPGSITRHLPGCLAAWNGVLPIRDPKVALSRRQSPERQRRRWRAPPAGETLGRQVAPPSWGFFGLYLYDRRFT